MPLIPLFPLDVVLFPGVGLPLHIFEPRYKAMIGECLAEKQHFGVVRVHENALAPVGCTAEIVALLKRYDDGRMDIVTAGRRRFELLQLDHEREFVRAEVIFFDDEGGAPTQSELERAQKLHEEMATLVASEQQLPTAESTAASFRLAAALPSDLDFKQALLAMRSEKERIVTLTEYYEAAIPKLRHMRAAQKRAGGNGHVH